MPLAVGNRLGAYEITGSLGAGGMGEVYRARDTKLNRDVALKVLPEAFADDPDRLARFEREAHVLASLNHPQIAAIYGVEDSTSVKALVMELVDGNTLAERIAQGPIPVEEALPLARQIATALEAAHEQGIIHRDLKPANVKVRDDGTVKVLDFGLAKLAESIAPVARSPISSSQSPTLASPVTAAGIGVILGTAAYMSPEQARGKAVDKRTDVWAFGAVLYEMLTGKRAFAGEDLTEIIAAVVKTTPEWKALGADVPPEVVSLIKGCLEKDRHARIGDMAVARFVLSQAGSHEGRPVAASGRRTSIVLASIGIVAAFAVGTVLGWLLTGRSTRDVPVTHLEMGVAPADQFAASAGSVRPSRTAMAVSPDGRLMVFAAMRGTTRQLYRRGLDQAEAAPIAGTDGGAAPFFSPDGAWIGFWGDGTIKKIPTAGGPAISISDRPVGPGAGAVWAEDGTIFFSNGRAIFKVSSSGGTPSAVTMPDIAAGEVHVLPHLLPGAKALLFTSFTGDWNGAKVIVRQLETGEQHVLIEGGSDARYVNSGHILYLKTGTLMAVPFDVPSLRVSGSPVAVLPDVMQAVAMPTVSDETGAGQFAVSPGGTLVYITGGVGRFRESEFVWVDRSGAASPIAAMPARPYLFPRLSPDGQKLAVGIRREATRATDVWVFDVTRGVPNRLTFDGAGNPIWSPDSTRIAFTLTEKNQPPGLYQMNAGGAGKAERIATADFPFSPSSWAGGAIALVRTDSRSGIWIARPGEKAPQMLVESRFGLMYPEFSPDGRWLAYTSNETGQLEVYVQPSSGAGDKVRISTDGGVEPLWSPDGRELLYRAFMGDKQRFMSVALRSLAPLRADPPRLLFEAGRSEYGLTVPVRSWDISADGKRFLLGRFVASSDKPVTAMHVVQNWTEELKRRVR